MQVVIVETDSAGCSHVARMGPPSPITLIRDVRDSWTVVPEVLASAPLSVHPGEVAVSRLSIHDESITDGYQHSPHRITAMDLPPRGRRWSIVHYGKHAEAAIHQTATVDYDLVLSGSIDILLDREAVSLTVGDAVLIPGARHGWRTTEEECVLAVLMLSLTPGF
jgi:ethanolamine utilization protein EutQ (cupin superfamily)